VAAPHVSCEALEANCFQIRCPLEDETSLSVFIQLATEFIAVESDKNLEVFEVKSSLILI